MDMRDCRRAVSVDDDRLEAGGSTEVPDVDALRG